MRRKTFLPIVFTLVLILVLSGPVLASTVNNTGVQIAQDGETLKIGLLTDKSSALQAYGYELSRGFEMGLDYATEGTMEVAGRPIEIVERDNAGDVDTAIEDARILFEEEGVEFLVGTVSSTVTLNLQSFALENDVILMAGPAASPAITSDAFNVNTFRVCRNTFQDAFAISSFAIEEFGPSYIILAADTAFGTGTAAAFDFALQARGASPIQDTILVAFDTTDFTNPLTEVLDSGADFVIIVWAGATGVTLINQARDLGVFDEMGLLQGTDTNYHIAAGNLAIADTAAYIVYHYTLPDNEINDWLVEQSQERYEPFLEAYAAFYPGEGEVPGLFTECGFATAQAVVAALEATEGDTLPEAMIPALEGLTWEGPKGEYYIRPEDHQALQPMYIINYVDVAPEAPFAYFELVQEVSGEDSAPPCLAPGRSSEELECPPAPDE
ncbi:MAG: substrate-binding domain-containing protein [Chloroflexi bacterium]|nr:substrate-binding domain-containing protein [Chloroflexota bacterium]